MNPSPSFIHRVAIWLGLRPRIEGRTPTGERLDLGPTERAVWSHRQTSNLMVVLALALLVGAIITAVVDAVPPAIIMAVAAVLVASFGQIRVTTGPAGLTVRFGFGSPKVKVPLEDIATAEVAEIHPAEWGGWGYRIAVPKGGRRTAVVLRAGDGIRALRRDGSEFAVTVDGADEGVRVLLAHLERAAATA